MLDKRCNYHAQKKDANKLKYINRSDDTAGNLGYKSDESQGKSQSKLENLYKNQNTDFIKEYDDLKDVRFVTLSI